MSGNATIFDFPPLKSNTKVVPPRVVEDDCEAKKPAMVLDMGEASREQGFRLNGCR